MVHEHPPVVKYDTTELKTIRLKKEENRKDFILDFTKN